METRGSSLCFLLYISKYCTELYIRFQLLNYKIFLVQILGKGKFIHHANNTEQKMKKEQLQKFDSVQSKKVIFVKNISYLPNSIRTGLQNNQHCFKSNRKSPFFRCKKLKHRFMKFYHNFAL